MAKADEDFGPFTGFGPEALSFFQALVLNQNREWFQAHQGTYETHIRRPLGAFVEALAMAFAAHDVPLTGSAKSSIFRINRDVRFSKDKSPYKTNAGAVLSRDGTKAGKGILYFQVGGAEEAFAGVGFYGPEPEDLAAIRRAIAATPERWLETEDVLKEEGLVLTRGHALARMPKGFEHLAASPVAEALRLRNFIVARTIPRARLFEAALVNDVFGFANAAMPLLAFGRSAIDGAKVR
jgi:uncharacterized protein (TIGR02453 family)